MWQQTTHLTPVINSDPMRTQTVRDKSLIYVQLFIQKEKNKTWFKYNKHIEELGQHKNSLIQ